MENKALSEILENSKTCKEISFVIDILKQKQRQLDTEFIFEISEELNLPIQSDVVALLSFYKEKVIREYEESKQAQTKSQRKDQIHQQELKSNGTPKRN